MKSGAAVHRAASAPGTADSRKAILLRVALATIALLMLAVALWVLDQDQDQDQDQDKASLISSSPSASGNTVEVVQGKPAPPPPAPGTPENAATAPVGDVAASQQGAGSPPDPELPATPTGEAGPTVAEPAAPQAGAGGTAVTITSPAGTPQTAPAETPVDSPAAPERPAQAAAPDAARASRFEPAPPPGPGFLVQLGVFVDTGKAETLRRELAGKGYPAHLQARVVLGPFPDRRAALAAQEKIRRERKLDGIILPPRKP